MRRAVDVAIYAFAAIGFATVVTLIDRVAPSWWLWVVVGVAAVLATADGLINPRSSGTDRQHRPLIQPDAGAASMSARASVKPVALTFH